MPWSLCCKDQRPSEVWLLTADRKHSTLTLISCILHPMDIHCNLWTEVDKAMRRQGANWRGNGLGVGKFLCFWHTTQGDLVVRDPSMVMKVWVGKDQGGREGREGRSRQEVRGERWEAREKEITGITLAGVICHMSSMVLKYSKIVKIQCNPVCHCRGKTYYFFHALQFPEQMVLPI